MADLMFSYTPGSAISDEMLAECAELFSNQYGIWGEQAHLMSKYTKPGGRVKMTSAKLRSECLSAPEKTCLSFCRVVGEKGTSRLIGHAFASVWEYEKPDGQKATVGWVTQLVVEKPFRRDYVASRLIQYFQLNSMFESVSCMGIASSHPAACAALSNYTSETKLSKGVNLDFIRANAARILSVCPISYLGSASLKGSLFNKDCVDGSVSSVFTKFYVDHREPRETLESMYGGKPNGVESWPLGKLVEGHEYLLIVPTK